MAKYRIVAYDRHIRTNLRRHEESGYRVEQLAKDDVWVVVSGTYADTPEEAEQKLRDQLFAEEIRNRPPKVVKELEI